MINARRFLFAFAAAAILFSTSFSKETAPDTAIAGVELGDRASAKALFGGYQPTFGDEGQPEYYFYNGFADQVIRFTADSWEDRFLITAIEVYAVTEKYRSPHFQLKEINYFETSNELFLGWKQTAMGLLSGFAIGVQDPAGKSRVRTGRVLDLFGEPDEKVEKGNDLTLVYRSSGMKVKDIEGPQAYEAEYSFKKGKLKRVKISVESEK